ncbi:streptophobe family protein [Streptomyces sp. enrichment culture]|uniref:streptophobe family protein n=1 Tax=Streptomyces sp. enrichment culture TaxID=1795815 RepID=UPI003F571FC3
MGAATGAESARDGARVPWGDVLMSAVAAVSWALIGMAGTAALGLRLLEADAAGSLGPMTAAVVALAAGGSVTPSGDVSAFGLTGAEADTAIEITPLGVSLVGAVLLSWFFLRSLRAAGVVIAPAELLARAGAVIALFVAMLGGLAWAGHDVITIDGGSLGLDDVPGGGGGIEVPGLGDIGGLLPDRLGELVDAQAAVGFTVDTAPTLLGGLGWSAGILAIALLASRRTPLPPGWEAVHRVVRPAASAVVTVLLVAVAAGLAAAAYAAVGDDHPRRVAGAALLGAPNGVWLGVPLGLFVPWDGRATGELTRFLPDPLDDLLGSGTDRPVTLGRLAELDQRVWLLGVAAALMMLLGGVLTAVRTPVVRTRAVRGGSVGSGLPGGLGASGGSDGSGVPERLGAPGVPGGPGGPGGPDLQGVPGRPGAPGRSGALRASGALAFAGRCALRLGAATGLALPLLAWLTDVSVTASLSVLGFDAFGAGLDLHGHLGMALLLGAVWGAGAGGAGALLAWAFGVAGRSATALALAAEGRGRGEGDGPGSGAGSVSGSVSEAAGGFAGVYDGGRTGPGPAGRVGDGAWPGYDGGAGRLGPEGRSEEGPEAGPGAGGAGGPGAGGGAAGPWAGVTPQGYREGAGPSGPEGGQAGAGGTGSRGSTSPPRHDAGRPGGPGTAGREAAAHGEESGPYAPGVPYRPPNPATNPYLRVPDELREPEDARPGDHSAPRRDSSATPQDPSGTPPDPSGTPGAHSAASATPEGRSSASEGRSSASEGRSAAPEDDSLAPEDDSGEGDIYGAPTVVRPVGPPPRGPRQSRGPGNGNGPPARPDEWPPPPPPPPPPPRTPRGGR